MPEFEVPEDDETLRIALEQMELQRLTKAERMSALVTYFGVKIEGDIPPLRSQLHQMYEQMFESLGQLELPLDE